MLKILPFLFIGGGLGAVSRYTISKLIASQYSGNFPLGTILSNLVACVILAVVVYAYAVKPLGNQRVLYFFLVTGFCGGLSTFSTFSYETIELLKQGNFWFAFLNVLLSVLVGFGAMYFIYQKSISS